MFFFLQQLLSPEAAQLLPQPPQVNGSSQPSQPVSSQEAPQPTGPSPLPQQVQQYPLTPSGLQSITSTTPAMPNVSQQPQLQLQPQPQPQPQFPPGVKVAQVSTTEQPGVSMLAPQQQAPQTIGAQRPPSTSQQLPPAQRSSSAFPGSLSDLVMSFENVKQKGQL